MIRMTRTFSTFAVLVALAAPVAAQEADDRLVIVSGKSGRVIYDDGRDDLYCMSRRHFIGYDFYGRRHYYRALHCR